MKKQQSKKYHSVITKRILHSVKKLSAVFLIVSFVGSLLTIPGTNAGFFDIEESKKNVFVAGSLDGRASYVEYFQVTGMNPEQSPKQRITFRNEGSLDFRYGVEYRIKPASDATLCESLQLKAEKDGVTVYTDALVDFDVKEFASNPFVLTPGQSDNWDFTLSLPDGAGVELENLSCQWYFDFTAWQAELSDATNGFSDVEAVGLHSMATGEWLSPGDVVINEVMWMGSTVSTSDEWIELKNMTDQDIDLSNWDIENGGVGAGQIEIPNGYTIKANGYFLIMKRKWDESAVDLDADLSKSKGYTHVSGMNLLNDGEQLTLEDGNDTVIDQTPVAPWTAGANGTLRQSMERNDIPGDGTIAANWHTCVSGAANGAPYWNTVGSNFGTPLAANLSPIVMNEFVPNPIGDDSANKPEGEWIELYNILDMPIDVVDWYFTNRNDDVVTIVADRTADGTTLVPGKGTLVVYLEESFLDNDKDTLSLFAPAGLPETLSDDIREDIVKYEDVSLLPEGKSFARFPDGEGIWLDPEATPGAENVMTDAEKKQFRRLAFEACFKNEELGEASDTMCSPFFLVFIDMIDDLEDKTLKSSVVLEVLMVIQKEETDKLLALLGEDGVVTVEEQAYATVTVPEEEPVEEVAEEQESDSEEPTEETEETLPVIVPTPTPTPIPTEPVTEEPTPATPVVDETETAPLEPVTEEIPEEVLATEPETPSEEVVVLEPAFDDTPIETPAN